MPVSSASEDPFSDPEFGSPIGTPEAISKGNTVNGSYSDIMGSRSSESEPDQFKYPPSAHGTNSSPVERITSAPVSLFLCLQSET